MKTTKTIAMIVIFLSLSVVNGADRVNSSFLGTYKLIENIEGDCPETLEVKERETSKYSLWLTYRKENNQFAGNEKYTDINAPTDSKTDSCMTAGPVIPFCYETRKEQTRYDQGKQILEKFYGRKSNYSKTAKYKYSKVENIDGNLKVTQLEMEKPLPPGVFSMTPISIGATNTAYNPFLKIKKHLVCNFSKN